MLKPFDKWILIIKKSYVDLEFSFDTAQDAERFYDIFMTAYQVDKDDISARLFAIKDEDEKEEEEN